MVGALAPSRPPRSSPRLPWSERRTLGNLLVDLRSLKGMHPLLPAVTAAGYVHRPALALQRQGHAPGVVGTVTVESGAPIPATFSWDAVNQADEAQIDRLELTEHAAEAVSLRWCRWPVAGPS